MDSVKTLMMTYIISQLFLVHSLLNCWVNLMSCSADINSTTMTPV